MHILTTFNKIVVLLKEQGKTQKQLMEYLGLGKTAFTGWKIGQNTSYYKHIGKIAEFFDVSADYLLGTEKNPLSEDEEWINNLYNMAKDLSESEKIALKSFIAGLKANRKP